MRRDSESSFKRKGYDLDTALARQELYRLLCYVQASKQVYDLDRTALNLLCCEFERAEITRTLINTAIVVRLYLDSRPSEPPCHTETVAGELTIDLKASQNTVPLQIREACNKIIHAHEIIFETGISGQRLFANTHLLPTITLLGERGAIRWKATIDIPRFVESACDVLPL